MGEYREAEHEKIIEAFSDLEFQERVNQYRYQIEKELRLFIEWLVDKLEPSQKIFRSPESRIKSDVSFEEKIYRKDYIHKWEFGADKESIQHEILANLPDLIGFRITCYFIDDEPFIYDKLKEYHDKLRKFSNIQLDFSEGTQQKNGLVIYKVSGKYKGDEEVSFELQIKAAVHNVWGEVDHKTIYKGRQYLIDPSEKQTVTNEIFNILKASDHQLLALFKNQYTQDDLVCGLFAEQTREVVKEIAKTDYLGNHYKMFFSVFFGSGKEELYSYVSATLIRKPEQYKKKRISVGLSKKEYSELIEDIKSAFLDYYLQIQFCMAQELYVFDSYDSFLLYMVEIVAGGYISYSEPEQIEDDAFDDEDENQEPTKDERTTILDMLKDKLPDALKERT